MNALIKACLPFVFAMKIGEIARFSRKSPQLILQYQQGF